MKSGNKTIRNLFLFLFLFSLLSCRGTKSKKFIDYSNLDTVNAKLIAEIGKGSLLGPLENLVVNLKGDLLVSTTQKKSIEQFNADGIYVGTVAHKGKGPGEISGSAAMFMANDTLVVQQYPSFMVSFYAENHDSLYTFIKSVVQPPNEKHIEVMAYAGGNKYWGTTEKPGKNSAKNNLRYREEILVVVNQKMQIIQDSVNSLKRPNLYAFSLSLSGVTMALGTFGFPQRDAFQVLNDSRYVIARSKYGTLLFFNNRNEKVNTIALNIKPRPVTKEDIQVLFKDMPLVKKALKKHLAAYKPAFVHMWVTRNYIWFDTGQVNKKEQFVAFTRKGKALGKFFLPLEASVQKIRNKKAYAIYHSKKGDRIRIYKIDL
jgi:hypothetical protein